VLITDEARNSVLQADVHDNILVLSMDGPDRLYTQSANESRSSVFARSADGAEGLG
jgi:hypothetical protein